MYIRAFDLSLQHGTKLSIPRELWLIEDEQDLRRQLRRGVARTCRPTELHIVNKSSVSTICVELVCRTSNSNARSQFQPEEPWKSPTSKDLSSVSFLSHQKRCSRSSKRAHSKTELLLSLIQAKQILKPRMMQDIRIIKKQTPGTVVPSIKNTTNYCRHGKRVQHEYTHSIINHNNHKKTGAHGALQLRACDQTLS